MNQIKHAVRYFVLSLSFLAVSACGGGGSGASDPSTETLSGSLDIPIEGLPYKTETLTGITTENGDFNYQTGETITFYLGDTVIGHTAATAEVDLNKILPEATYLTSESEIRAAFNTTENASPFITITNILRLIYSLDEDGSLNNGISISESSRLAFEGISLTFDQAINRFADNTFIALNNTDKTLFTPSVAIAYTYKILGISIFSQNSNSRVLSSPTSISEDTDGDGHFDRVINYSYDDYGNLTEYKADYDGDNNTDYLRQITRLNSGQQAQITDFRIEGSLGDHLQNTSYDSAGRETQSEYGNNSNGSIDFIITKTYSSDSLTIITEYDTNGDGNYQFSHTARYDSNYRILETETNVTEYDQPTNHITYTYNSEGSHSHDLSDSDGDGSIDSITDTTYNLDNRATRIESDIGADGSINSIIINSYNENGDKIKETRDNDNNGTIDYISIEKYDSHGHRLAETTDYDNNGNPDFLYTATYSDAQQILTESYDWDGSGANIITKIFTYNSNNQISTVEERSTDINDSVYIHYYFYNEQNLINRYEVDHDSDGSINSVSKNFYDTFGNLSEVTQDNDNNGVIDSRIVATRQLSTQIDAKYDIMSALFAHDWENLSFNEFKFVLQ